MTQGGKGTPRSRLPVRLSGPRSAPGWLQAATLPLLLVLLAACGTAATPIQTITNTEPQYVPIVTGNPTQSDVSLYADLSHLNPPATDPVALAIAIDRIDPGRLPVTPARPVRIYQVGDRRTFWTRDIDTGTYTRITATLMAISVHAYFWQDLASRAVNAAGRPASPQDWQAAADSFDQSYERVRAVFGAEASPGLDGDPRLFVVHSEALGKVGGYYGEADELPALIDPYSNEGEYFYVSNTWSGGIASDYYKAVLAHEYQHMIQHNLDPNEDGWMNEGLSMLAQQVAGLRGDNFVADYLAKPDQSLWYWGNQPADYGQAYLYLDYLDEQMGPDFITALSADPLNGLASIDHVLSVFHSPRDADQMYADALTAAFFNNPALAEGQYAYTHPSLPAMSPTYAFTSLPAVYQGTVQQYGGADLIAFSGSGTAHLNFTGNPRGELIPTRAHSGSDFWWSDRSDSTFATLTHPVDLTGTRRATLNYWAWYDTEMDHDYAYLLVSVDDGAHWNLVSASTSTDSNPNGLNLGHGFTGISGGGNSPAWVQESADLSAFAGRKILVRFAMQNDRVVNEYGFAVDDLSIPEIGWSDDFERGDPAWEAEGFILSHNEIPQVWTVRAVEQKTDGTLAVHDLALAGGQGQLAVDFSGAERLLVFVIGQTRFTTLPASYRLAMEP